MADTAIAVLATLDSKAAEARFACRTLIEAGAMPVLIDMSLRPHNVEGAAVSGGLMAEAGGTSWPAMAKLDRAQAAEAMVGGGIRILDDRYRDGKIAGVIALGGANGTSMACDMMRALPALVPKVMVSTMAGTPAVEWYVGESDIVMFPSIGDIMLNRITGSVIEHACWSIAAMVERGRDRTSANDRSAPLIGISSFGGTAPCVDRVTERLAADGYEVIHFHASGAGGRALEHLAAAGELAGVIDVTTHELADLAVGGVFSAGDGRLRSAGRTGLPQVIVPGALDHANFWVGRVPDRFRHREFYRFNKTNLLMRTNGSEFEALGRMVAERLNEAEGEVVVLIPAKGFSEHSGRRTHDLDGAEMGAWSKPTVDARFARSLRRHLKKGRIEELDMHVNDRSFADACVEALFGMRDNAP